jgi:hypothetical protein
MLSLVASLIQQTQTRLSKIAQMRKPAQQSVALRANCLKKL